MIIWHQSNVAAFAGNHTYWFLPQQIITARVSKTTAAPTGRIMSGLAGSGGLAHKGGLAGQGGGLAA